MSAVSTDPPKPITAPAPTRALVQARAVVAKVTSRPRRRRTHGLVGYFLLAPAACCTTYTGGWLLCLLHGAARVLVAGAISTAYLVGSALWRRGWLG